MNIVYLKKNYTMLFKRNKELFTIFHFFFILRRKK